MKAGDVVTVSDVYAVNRLTKKTTGRLREFVVIKVRRNGKPELWPPMLSEGQYRTVVKTPKANAAITVIRPA